jgi:Family of unknown function (DUF6504)
MRIYDEPVDVRRGLVGGQEAPEQFIWRDKLWVVTAIVSHWLETGAWWDQAGVAELLGVVSAAEARWSSSAEGSRPQQGSDLDKLDHRGGAVDHRGGAVDDRVAAGHRVGADLLAERELWRVEAARGRLARFMGPHASGVFDLCFDWAAGQWTLTRTLD